MPRFAAVTAVWAKKDNSYEEPTDLQVVVVNARNHNQASDKVNAKLSLPRKIWLIRAEGCDYADAVQKLILEAFAAAA